MGDYLARFREHVYVVCAGEWKPPPQKRSGSSHGSVTAFRIFSLIRSFRQGAIEILGPYGISYTFRRLAERISQLQSGSVVRRVRYEPWPPTSLTARHLQFTIEAQMETDEIQALAKVDI
ncbi:hypothetical protein ZWY2020_020941 [Hordeum vulgare]|nr:hypothetical protein ZWY2020_020941 [Hordeum vulgare]